MLSGADLAGELAQQRRRVVASKEPLDEPRPAQGGTHLDAQPNLAVRRVPGQVARPGWDDDGLAGAGGALLVADPERRGPAEHLVALLHLGMDVGGGPVARPRPGDVHR